MPVSFRIDAATSPADLAAAAGLFRDYASSIGIDLSYQDFDTELASLPGKYAAPAGALYLARNDNSEPVGCVALRPFPAPGCCEMKRLYVSPRMRGGGLGHALVQTVLREAIRLGYREMRLDTLPTMNAAVALYEAAGFRRIPAYYGSPIPETIFFALTLAS